MKTSRSGQATNSHRAVILFSGIASTLSGASAGPLPVRENLFRRRALGVTAANAGDTTAQLVVPCFFSARLLGLQRTQHDLSQFGSFFLR